MGFTEGRWEQGSSSGDLQFFVGAEAFIDTSAHAVAATQGAGLFDFTIAASLASTFFANLGPYLRTGIYATPAFDQEEFGTAAGTPGPSTVANTNGPLGLPAGFPPIAEANLTTIAGSINGTGTGIQRGPLAKGMQIDSIDVIYTATGAALTTATVGLTKTVFVNNTAPAVTNLIALGANGLPTAIQAQPYLTNVAVPVPAMITSADAEIVANVNLTTQAGGSAIFYGIVVHAHYNYN